MAVEDPGATDTAPVRASILEVRRNCWRIAPARRVAMLVDGAAYFAAFAAAAERARRSIRIPGWDLNTNVRLRRDGGDRPEPGLAEFLDALTRDRPELRIEILSWDFAAIYAFERELFAALRFRYRTGERVRLELDAQHPVGASQHQKVVVVDDAIAFVGGLDLTINRWDTRAHRPDDPRRRDGDVTYPPFHDVQLAVDGDAARALGELFRRRWWRATGESLDPVRPTWDCWPDRLRPDIEDAGVAIARTEPAKDRRDADTREVERLYLDAIAAARESIFIENQYLTSATVGEALCARLAEETGPQVVIVGPCTCSGWLEEATMGVLRARLVGRLRGADRHGRLRLLYPVVGGERRITVNVHSKLMIVDDVLLRVGSANLSNRSMGLDSECDLAIEACDEATRRAIRALRSSLLAEHLGAESARVDAAVAATGSLAAAVDHLRAAPSERTLLPLDTAAAPWLDGVLPDASLIDPDRPFGLSVLESFAPETGRRHREPAWSRLLRSVGGLRERWLRWAGGAAEPVRPGAP